MPKPPHRSPPAPAAPGPSLVPPRPRPRDLLKLTATPIHPFDQIHHVDTSGLVPARHLRTGHPSDDHVTAYNGVAPSILTSLVERWRETLPPHPHLRLHLRRHPGAGQRPRRPRRQRAALPPRPRRRAQPRTRRHRPPQHRPLDSRPPRRPHRLIPRPHRPPRAGRPRPHPPHHPHRYLPLPPLRRSHS